MLSSQTGHVLMHQLQQNIEQQKVILGNTLQINSVLVREAGNYQFNQTLVKEEAQEAHTNAPHIVK